MNQLQEGFQDLTRGRGVGGTVIAKGKSGLRIFTKIHRAGRASKIGSESMPFIHEKWRKSDICTLAPGTGDLERATREDDKIKLKLRRLRVGIRWFQMICSLLIVALIGQSLVMFQATKDSLIDATTRVWPVGVEVWPSVVVLSMNVIIMLFALVMVVTYFYKYTVVKKLANWYTALLVATTLCTTGIFIMNAILLKARPTTTLPLSKVACILASTSHRLDHTTICQSHNWSFNCTIIHIVLDSLILLSIYFMRQRRQTQRALHRSTQSVQMKLKDFNLSKPSIRIPSPTYRKPMLYPGRVWRLEWGDMEEPLSATQQRFPPQSGQSGYYPPRQPSVIPHELMALPEDKRMSVSTVESLPIRSPLPAYTGPASPPAQKMPTGSSWF